MKDVAISALMWAPLGLLTYLVTTCSKAKNARRIRAELAEPKRSPIAVLAEKRGLRLEPWQERYLVEFDEIYSGPTLTERLEEITTELTKVGTRVEDLLKEVTP